MNSADRMDDLFRAVDIAMAYLLRRGFTSVEANALVGSHVPRLFENGERRPLVAANLALGAIERELSEQAEQRKQHAERTA
jgi:hypothetical protein